MDQYMMRIIEKKELANKIFQMDLQVLTNEQFKSRDNYQFRYMDKNLLKHIDNGQFKRNDSLQSRQWKNPKPGQFLYIRVSDSSEPLLRRPISIYDYDEEREIVKIIFRIEGEGTKRLSLKQKDDLLDVLGPLGNGFSFKSNKNDNGTILIGGGIGIPPLYYLAKQLVNNRIRVTTILGFQSKQDAFLINEFSKLGETRIASMDGTIGTNGTVLDVISDNDHWDTFYACGPAGMLKALKERWVNHPIEGFISLEERMGCGIGACYGCIVKLDRSINDRGYKKVCSDGPVFDFREVIL